MQQTFYDFSAFDLLKDKKPLLVCDRVFDSFEIEFPGEAVRFSAFTSNPIYEDVMAGVEVLRENECDFIVAVGGGSSIDTAKSIKYYSRLDLPIMAVPTTSGTGSEATHFAVIYRDGKKLSVAGDHLLPEYVILQAELLKTLPLYQKKCTMLDALCQAIESWWSKRASEESIRYSKEAIRLILGHMESYLRNEAEGNAKMLLAANFAGKAINITTTTAPHAMSYKLTSLYRLPHGHAVAICLPKVWRYMGNFDDIAHALGKRNHEEAISFFEDLLQKLEIRPPQDVNADDVEVLTDSVDPERLSNNPMQPDRETIRSLYKEILGV
ncbi:MAG: phosphonoacetaldehyde reductase [Clostridiaceae bacterium]|nr:phosphonoacetaldehyde reductase [Clostridiaceae bacterium]